MNKYQLVFLGDDHDMNQGRNWLSDQIKEGKLKIDFLALEYIETSKQNLLEKGNKLRAKKYLDEVYKEFPGFSSDSILKIIDVCQQSKIKVFGIEMPEESFKDWRSEVAQSERTKYIASRIIELTKIGKGIVLIGADHVEKIGNNVFDIVRKNLGEVNTISMVMIGGREWSIDTEDYWIRKLEIKAQREKKSKEFYFFKVDNNSYPTDWIIHFPQIEKKVVLEKLKKELIQ